MLRRLMPLAFGYHTSGFAFHRLEDALRIIRETGYAGAAVTLDVHHLDPFRAGEEEVRALAALLRDLGLRSVVETGARFLLDPRRRHHPTLISRDGGERRMDLLRRAVDLAAALGAEAVSFWSGARDPFVPEPEAWERLEAACRSLLELARSRKVALAFEPEPGMLVDSLAKYADLRRRTGEDLFLTLDVGHIPCAGEGPIADRIADHAPLIRNVHLEDIRGNVHEHLAFGEGEILFRPVLSAFRRAGCAGLLNVELSRHGHDAPETARRSLEFLREKETDGP